jgi:hypothetical protein
VRPHQINAGTNTFVQIIKRYIHQTNYIEVLRFKEPIKGRGLSPENSLPGEPVALIQSQKEDSLVCRYIASMPGLQKPQPLYNQNLIPLHLLLRQESCPDDAAIVDVNTDYGYPLHTVAPGLVTGVEK